MPLSCAPEASDFSPLVGGLPFPRSRHGLCVEVIVFLRIMQAQVRQCNSAHTGRTDEIGASHIPI
jgi:hypothetical protein